jgi:hypothetical protein
VGIHLRGARMLYGTTNTETLLRLAWAPIRSIW